MLSDLEVASEETEVSCSPLSPTIGDLASLQRHHDQDDQDDHDDDNDEQQQQQQRPRKRPQSWSAASTSSDSSDRSLSPGIVRRVKAPQPANQSMTGGKYTCVECGKHYATSSNLSRHKQTHRSPDSQLAKKCPTCDKVSCRSCKWPAAIFLANSEAIEAPVAA